MDTVLEECAALRSATLAADWYACKGELGPRMLASAAASFAAGTLAPRLAALEAALERNVSAATTEPRSARAPAGLSHIVGGGLTVADVVLYTTLCFLRRNGLDLPPAAPRLTTFVHQMAAMCVHRATLVICRAPHRCSPPPSFTTCVQAAGGRLRAVPGVRRAAHRRW